MEYKNNILYTDLKEVSFDFPIKQILRYKGIYIVLISPLDNLEYPSNVFGVNPEGDIMWRIKSFNKEQIIFHSIEVNINNGKLYLKDFNHFKYIIDTETGEIISGKIRPLEDDSQALKEKEPLKIKNIDSSFVNKFLNKKTLLLLSILFLFMLLLIGTKNLKINSLEKQIKKQETLITTLENTLIAQEEEIVKYEEAINNSIAQTNSVQTIPAETTNEIQSEETLLQENINTISPVPTREETVDNGVSKVVDFINTLVGNVSSGTPITIDEVNNKSTINDGIIVSEILDGQRIKVSKDSEEFVVKLISISNCDKSTLEQIIPTGTQIYLETDSKQYNDAGEMLAYVWVTQPNPENLNSMLNYAILKSNFGTFVNEPPNIKYNRYFF